jgi:hypothetical protein
MGTIIARKRKDGTTAHLAQLLIKRDGAIVHRESRTFDRKQAASSSGARPDLGRSYRPIHERIH